MGWEARSGRLQLPAARVAGTLRGDTLNCPCTQSCPVLCSWISALSAKYGVKGLVPEPCRGEACMHSEGCRWTTRPKVSGTFKAALRGMAAGCPQLSSSHRSSSLQQGWEAHSKPKILLLNFHSAGLYTYLWVGKLTLGLGSLIQGIWNSSKLYTKSWSEFLQWTKILNALLAACPSSPSLQVLRESWEVGLVED